MDWPCLTFPAFPSDLNVNQDYLKVKGVSSMYTRVVECRVKMGKKGEFFDALQNQILPLAKKQPGFVDLMGWASDEHEDHVIAMTFWKTKEDADRFYRQESPMVAVLGPFSAHLATEHYYVPISTGHNLAVGKAATT